MIDHHLLGGPSYQRSMPMEGMGNPPEMREVWKRTGVVYAMFERDTVTVSSASGFIIISSKNDKKILKTLAETEGNFAFISSKNKLSESEIQRIRTLFQKANIAIRKFDMKVSDGDSDSEAPKWVDLNKRLQDMDDSTIFVRYGFDPDAPTSRLEDGTWREIKFARFINGEMIDGDDEEFFQRLVETKAKSVVFMTCTKSDNDDENKMFHLIEKAGMAVKEFWVSNSRCGPGMVNVIKIQEDAKP